MILGLNKLSLEKNLGVLGSVMSVHLVIGGSSLIRCDKFYAPVQESYPAHCGSFLTNSLLVP